MISASTMFETAVEAPSIEYQGVRFDLESKGKQIDGGIRLKTANPKGRRGCHVTISRRKHWTDDELSAALRVAGHWLRDIGGINLLRTAALGHIIARLKQGQSVDMTERLMHWAVSAYAHAKWHRDNKAWTTLGRFFTGEHFDKWLNESTAYQSFLDHRESELNERREAEIRRKREYEEAALREQARREGRFKPSMPVAPIPSPLRDMSDAELRRMLDEEEQHSVAVSDYKYHKICRMVSDMDRQPRLAMLKLIKFENQNRWCEWAAPGELRSDVISGPMTLENRYYFQSVCHRLVFLMARHRGTTYEILMDEIEPDRLIPPHKHSRSEIVKEIERRRCAMHGATSHGHDLVSGARRRLRLPDVPTTPVVGF